MSDNGHEHHMQNGGYHVAIAHNIRTCDAVVGMSGVAQLGTLWSCASGEMAFKHSIYY